MRAPLVLLSLAACAPPPDAPPADPLSGGETTVFDDTRDAYARPAQNLRGDRRDAFFLGNAVFNTSWVAAPASVEGFDGLGPLYNAVSCAACHFKDGRGRPPEGDEPMLSMLLRLSVPGVGEHGGPRPEPRYGLQLNPAALPGVPPEGRARVAYDEVPGRFTDGEPFTLRRPRYEIGALGYGPLPPDALLSPRVAPAVFGLGLLEAVPEADVLARADPADTDGDGISGRPNWVWDVRRGARALGRFGWKANEPTVEQQSAAAFLGDIGITSSLFPAEGCTAAQPACTAAPSGGSPELSDRRLGWIAYYGRTLAVPARRDVDDPVVRRGAAVFREVGCGACHTPTLRTGELLGFPELSGQTIHPYTDLLLHDMGEGLADGRPDFEASGREWRTAPLWGLGLLERVNRHRALLHDGRARGPLEAVLWHGGEAEAAREAVRARPRADRDALVRFLESL